MGRFGRRGRAGDRQPIAAGDERNAELALDPVEMLVALAVKRRQQQIVVEFELGAAFGRGRRLDDVRREAPSCRDASPIGCFGLAAAICTGHDLADRSRLRRRHERSADRGCARQAGPDAGPAFRTAPAGRGRRRRALNARCCLASSACNSASRSTLTGSGTCSAADAAGVPGRGEYLNENAWAKPTSSTRSSVARKSSSLSPGNPTMKSDDSARSGRAARSRSTVRR